MSDPTKADVSIQASLGSFPKGGTAVVFGAGGGIGAAIANALLADDCFETVSGYSRSSETPINFEDEESIVRAAADVAASWDYRHHREATDR